MGISRRHRRLAQRAEADAVSGHRQQDSNSAMPQPAMAARYHGLAAMFLEVSLFSC